MSTSNKKAGKLNPSDLNVPSVHFCQCVGKLCWCCLQLDGRAEGSTHPPEASKVSSSSVQSSRCFHSALWLCAGGLGAGGGQHGDRRPLPSFVFAVNGGALDSHAGRGGMVCDTSLTVCHASRGHVPAM